MKVKVFLWNGLIQDVLTDSDESVEVEIIDAYTPKYGDMGSDEDAAEEYKKQCIASGFKNIGSFETGVYKNPPEGDDDEDDADDEE